MSNHTGTRWIRMNWRDRLSRFMYGRYGQDQFSRFLLGVCLVLLILSFFIRIPGLGILILMLLGYVYFRMLSKNITSRSAENRKYLELKERFLRFFKGKPGRAQRQGDNMIFRCPKCSQKIRIPCGKGMVEITCPRCRTKFRKRT